MNVSIISDNDESIISQLVNTMSLKENIVAWVRRLRDIWLDDDCVLKSCLTREEIIYPKDILDDYVHRKVNGHLHSREWVTNESVRIMHVRIRFSDIQMIGREWVWWIWIESLSTSIRFLQRYSRNEMENIEVEKNKTILKLMRITDPKITYRSNFSLKKNSNIVFY